MPKKPRGRPWPKGGAPVSPAVWQPGQSGNAGGRPGGQAEFRERCREGAAELLPVVVGRCLAGESRAADVMAFATVAGIGGLVPPARPTMQAPEGDAPAPGQPPGSIAEAVNVGVAGLLGQLQAVLAAAGQRPLEPAELAALTKLTGQLAAIQRDRGRLFIRAATLETVTPNAKQEFLESLAGPRPPPGPTGEEPEDD